MKKFALRSALAFLFLVTLTSRSALACAACWGDTTGDRMGVAASWGIFAMVVIMFLMLGTITAFGYYLNWRAKNPLPDYDNLLSDEPPQQ
jgi:hypothetical protein